MVLKLSSHFLLLSVERTDDNIIRSMLNIYITGPESTGKTTLSHSLSMHYGCPWVPEYARQYLLEKQGVYDVHDLDQICAGQIEWNQSFERFEPKKLIHDTGAAVLYVWSEHKFETVNPGIKKCLANQKKAFHLLCKPDIEWVADPLRESPFQRDILFDKYIELLKTADLPYGIVRGEKTERLNRAISLVDKYEEQVT